MNKEWLEFIYSLGIETEFLHRDEYAAKYGAPKANFPAVFFYDGNAFQREIIAKDDFEAIENLDALKNKVREEVGRLAAPESRS